MLVSFGLKNAFPKTKDMDAIQREVIQTFSSRMDARLSPNLYALIRNVLTSI